MRRLISSLSVSASESQLGVALVLAASVMALMLWAILWQANIITNQRDVIRWLWSVKLGGHTG